MGPLGVSSGSYARDANASGNVAKPRYFAPQRSRDLGVQTSAHAETGGTFMKRTLLTLALVTVAGAAGAQTVTTPSTGGATVTPPSVGSGTVTTPPAAPPAVNTPAMPSRSVGAGGATVTTPPVSSGTVQSPSTGAASVTTPSVNPPSVSTPGVPSRSATA